MPLVLSLRRESEAIDARDLEDELLWADPHDVAAAFVGRLAHRAMLLGDAPMRMRASELALAVPVARSGRRRLVARARPGPTTVSSTA